MALRRKSKYLVGFFRSMALAEIPELAVEDVDFLNETLAIGCDDKTAKRTFSDKFMEVRDILTLF